MAKNRLVQKRVATKGEPTLHIHKYIVQVKYPNKTKTVKWHYCANTTDVEELRKAVANQKKTQPGTVLEVFSATHNFREAFTFGKRVKK